MPIFMAIVILVSVSILFGPRNASAQDVPGMERRRQFDWRQSGQGRFNKRRSRCAAQAVPADWAWIVRTDRVAKRIIATRGDLAIPGSR